LCLQYRRRGGCWFWFRNQSSRCSGFTIKDIDPDPMPLKPIVRYSTLREINRTAISTSNITDAFLGTSRTVNKVISFDRIALSLYCPVQHALKIIAAAGQDKNSFYQVGLLFDFKASHHGWVFQNRKPLVRRNLEKEVEFRMEQPNVSEGIRSYCAVPLVARSESVGVLIVLSSQKNRYSTCDAEFLQEVSDEFVLAVKSLIPSCPKHINTKLFCPRCIASGGGQTTSVKYKAMLSDWGKKGGRGRKKADFQASSDLS
jgi:hypothetical protein